MSVHSPDAERAFRIFEALREEERNPPCCEFVEGQILHPGLDTSPCCERCSFQLLKRKRSRSNVYVCRQHARVHRCGLECKQKVSVPCKDFFKRSFTPEPFSKILSHEDWSCPWTGEVIEQSLFGEEVGVRPSCLWDGHEITRSKTQRPGAIKAGHAITASHRPLTKGKTNRASAREKSRKGIWKPLVKCAMCVQVSNSKSRFSQQKEA